MATTIKTLVSKKKQRYVEDGYNLDLSYINERVNCLIQLVFEFSRSSDALKLACSVIGFCIDYLHSYLRLHHLNQKPKERSFV